MTVTRADGTITASGYAVSGAAKYHVTYSSDGMQSWTAASDSHTGSSITITGVVNAKTYIVGVRAGNAGGWSVWTNSEAAGPYTPPPSAPANLSVTPGDGYLDIAWDAVSEATGYDVRAKTAGASDWHSVAKNVTGTTYRYTTDKTINKVAVRGVSADSVGPWVERSRMPQDDFMNVVTGAAAGGALASASGASIQSGGSVQAQLAAPTWGTISRTFLRSGTELYLDWTVSSGATGYNIVCSPGPEWLVLARLRLARLRYGDVHVSPKRPDQACQGHPLRAQGEGEPPRPGQDQNWNHPPLQGKYPGRERQPRRRQPMG